MARSRPTAVLAALAALAVTVPASAAGLPRSPMDELKSISDEVSADVNAALRLEWSHDMVRHGFTPSDDAPWRDPRAACAQPRNQYIQAFAEFIVRHVQPPPLGDRGAYGREASFIDQRLRGDITKAAAIPGGGAAKFLLAGENLKAAPHGWNEALRQRAEWTLVLDAVVGDVVAQSRRRADFGDNYIAGVWTRMACDFTDADRGFLVRWRASGGAPTSDRDAAALALLQSRAR